MHIVLVVLALVGLTAVLAALVRTVIRDGYGTLPPPRSHREELGSWVDQQLRR